MPTMIRLQRTGRKAQASFRIVVSDSAESRDGPAIETIGTYNPRTRPSLIRLDAAAALNWLYEGAQPTDTVVSIFRKTGVWEKYKAGTTADALEETVVELGPPEGERGTSIRAAIAAEAQKEAAKRRVEEKAVAEASAKKAAADESKKKAEEEAAQAVAEAEAAPAEEAEEVVAEAEAEVEAAAEEVVAEAEAEEEAEAEVEAAAEEVVAEAEAEVEAEAEEVVAEAEAEVEAESADEEDSKEKKGA
jgi:small subunit ribosomal protein S16